MKFRIARHTNNLEEIIEFYTNIIGLEILGSFQNHDDYDGVFLGFKELDWHMEFTVSKDKANHIPDPDDLTVFYFNSNEELETIQRKAEKNGFQPVPSKNPYWRSNGIELKDPDNFGVILTIMNKK